MNNTRNTIQKQVILNAVRELKNHPTSEEVYNYIKPNFPSISLGTVYRNLRFLVDQGDALSLKLGDGREHFDGHVEPHYHFICSQCGAVEDIFMDELNICEQASKHCSGEIHGHRTYFYGLCNNCKSKH